MHHFLAGSRANGPGRRAVIWVQGCSLGCSGCYNPATHDTKSGEWIEVANLLGRIKALNQEIEGITLSGGEPLQQWSAVDELSS